jgi:hypothetical protein
VFLTIESVPYVDNVDDNDSDDGIDTAAGVVESLTTDYEDLINRFRALDRAPEGLASSSIAGFRH